MEKTEEKIREKLAKNLGIFETGLSLIEQESFLPNTKGTRGFVDLLAKDSLNRHVLIELKRSKAASREAIHEIYKYIEGIKANKSLKNDELIAYIVSTEWEELLVPFSSFVKESSYEVIGYKLDIDDKLNPVSVERVQPLALCNERFISDQHAICLYTTDENLKKGLDSHLACFAEKGIEDFVLLVLKPDPKFYEYSLQATMRGLIDVARNFGKEQVPMTYEQLKEKIPEYQYMIYSAVQVMDNKKYWNILKKDKALYREVKEFAEDLDEKELSHHLHQNAVFNCSPLAFQEHYEIGYPAKLGNKILEDEAWEIVDMVRCGGLKENALLTDEAILGELTGDSGTNKQKYAKDFNSANKATFSQIINDIEKCLIDNEVWLLGMKKGIDELSLLSEKTLIQGRVQIHNPGNTLLSIYQVVTAPDVQNAMLYIPSYGISAEGENIKCVYFGCLIGNKNSLSLNDVFSQAYETGSAEFFLSLTWGGYQSNDLDICVTYGLEYANFKCEIDGHKRTFYKFDGFRYKKHEAIDPYIGIFKFIEKNDGFVKDLVGLFEKNTLTPGVIQF